MTLVLGTWIHASKLSISYTHMTIHPYTHACIHTYAHIYMHTYISIHLQQGKDLQHQLNSNSSTYANLERGWVSTHPQAMLPSGWWSKLQLCTRQMDIYIHIHTYTRLNISHRGSLFCLFAYIHESTQYTHTCIHTPHTHRSEPRIVTTSFLCKFMTHLYTHTYTHTYTQVKTSYRNNFFYQFMTLSHRAFMNNARNPGIFLVRLIMYTGLGAMVVGSRNSYVCIHMYTYVCVCMQAWLVCIILEVWSLGLTLYVNIVDFVMKLSMLVSCNCPCLFQKLSMFVLRNCPCSFHAIVHVCTELHDTHKLVDTY